MAHLRSSLGARSEKVCAECRRPLYVVKVGTSTLYVCDYSTDHVSTIIYYSDVKDKPLLLTRDSDKNKVPKSTKKSGFLSKVEHQEDDIVQKLLDVQTQAEELSCPHCPEVDLTSRRAWEIHMEFHNKQKKKFD